MLQQMFDKQRTLAQNFIPLEEAFSKKLSEEQIQEYLISYISLLQEETVEALRELPKRKFWRKSIVNKKVEWGKFHEELADIWHIVIALSLISGLDAQQVFEKYVEKNEINLKRVRENS